ncbi:MAG: hypothetical protein I3274_01065 [Candidatus Moeniiplasma glomeromycotorum]|nr:hypothetical protein [Candidatus Moeniiplasma glomeromycotorum]MCE8167211.1 hypothetical protein [Candidatus Moeniiplasma glomeromycotorum]
MKKFLITFWETQENSCYKKTLDDKILRYYRKQIKSKSQEENSQFLDLLVQYAEIYEKIININNNREWWEQNWSIEMFKVVRDIFLLDHQELTSLILATHFRFKENKVEEKLILSKELNKLVLYLFRAIIRKIEHESELIKIRRDTLQMISEGRLYLYGQEKYPSNLIIQEFQTGSESFFQALQEYKSKRNREQGIEKFILLTYYQKKIKEKGLKMDLISYEIKLLVSQNLELEEVGENKNSLGNLILMRAKEDFSLFPWNKKRLIYKQMGEGCLMNFEEDKNWTETENMFDLIAERKKYLIQDFRKLRIFEID